MADKIYTVQGGDSLSKIARDHLGDMERWKEIAFINGLSHPYIIQPGQILQMPDSEPSIVEIPPVASEPLRITVAGRKPAAPATAFNMNPATVKFLVVAGVALFLLNKYR